MNFVHTLFCCGIIFCHEAILAQENKNNPQITNARDHAALNIDSNSPEGVFLGKFFQEVIIKRSLASSMKYFCSREEYMKFDEIDSAPNELREINYANLKGMYVNDCSKIIDMLPKVHIDDIRLQRLEIVSNAGLIQKNGAIYRGVYTYSNGIEKFEIVFPTMVKVGDKLRFSTRFWVPMKFK